MSTTDGGQAPSTAAEQADADKRWLQEHAVFGDTRRMLQLERWSAHYTCNQYDHLKSDWNGQNADQLETVSPELNVPPGFEQPGLPPMVRARRPTAPSNLAKAVVDRFTGLIFSDARRPDVIAEGDPDTTEFLLAAMEQMRFWPSLREARAMGGSSGSVLVTAHLRRGKFRLEIHKPGDCQVMWADRRTLEPQAVLIMYKFLKTENVVDQKTGKITGTQEVNYLYRRIITTADDTVFKEVKLDGALEITWEEESRAQHDLGIFPGVWIQNLPVIGKEDGDPDCQGSWQMLDTYDRVIAQMNKAILLNLDPTPVIKSDPATIAAGGAKLGSDGILNVGENGDAKYMEMQGGAITIGMDFCKVLKESILQVVRCVFADPQALSGAAQSAKAIEYIYALMLEKADELRAQYGDLGILPLLNIILQIARATVGKVVTLADGKQGVLDIVLPPRPRPDGTLAPPTLGPGGYIQLKWGPYFAPTEQDRQQAVANINSARTGLLMDLETAIRAAAPIFDIKDPERIIAAVRAEMEKLEAMGYQEDGGVTESDLDDATAGKQKQLGTVADEKRSAAGGRP
jgi:hypothetical protein